MPALPGSRTEVERAITASHRANNAPVLAAARLIPDDVAESDPDFRPTTKVDSRILLALIARYRRTAPIEKHSVLDTIEAAAKRTCAKERARVKSRIVADRARGVEGR